jgi:DNA topoisomerase VI subunit B
MPATSKPRTSKPRRKATAQSMAGQQREISISEFFTKNRHLLGFDSPAKALLTTIKEAVDNSLDACEEAGLLPDILVVIEPVKTVNGNGNGNGRQNGNGDDTLEMTAEKPDTRKRKGATAPGKEERYRVIVQDNGPGIVSQQVPRIFGKLLYGSKFHSLRQSRGQQGIGISAAGMYGQLTTGKPVVIVSCPQKQDQARRFELVLDTKKNEPVVQLDEEYDWEQAHGTRVEIELTGSYKRGHHSVDTYLRQTAVANPHVRLVYRSPRGEEIIYPRAASELPVETNEIKPHPYGVELGMLLRMLKDTKQRNLTGFLRKEFCRVGPKTGTQILATAGFPARKSTRHMDRDDVQALLDAINETRIPNPPTDCLSPIGSELILAGLQQGFDCEFTTAVTRPPSVYRGNPFQIEVGLAYGGRLPAEDLAQVLRYANRVPLLYQASGCAIHKAVLGNKWRSYGLQQAKGAIPSGPLVILVHMASVWVPFTSESKEAVAHYPEIVKEIKLALQEAGRQLHRHIRRRVRERDALKKQSYIQKYIPHIGDALRDMLDLAEGDREKIITTLTDTLERSRKM